MRSGQRTTQPLRAFTSALMPEGADCYRYAGLYTEADDQRKRKGSGEYISDFARAEQGLWWMQTATLRYIVKIQHLFSSSRLTFIIIAHDECATVHRFRLFDSLKEILERSPVTQIFMI